MMEPQVTSADRSQKTGMACENASKEAHFRDRLLVCGWAGIRWPSPTRRFGRLEQRSGPVPRNPSSNLAKDGITSGWNSRCLCSSCLHLLDSNQGLFDWYMRLDCVQLFRYAGWIRSSPRVNEE